MGIKNPPPTCPKPKRHFKNVKTCPFCGKAPKVWEDALLYVRCETEGCPAANIKHGIPKIDWNKRGGK